MNFLSLLVLEIWGKTCFLEGGHFEIQDGGWMHACTLIFCQKFCSSIANVPFNNFTWSYLNLYGPFPTIAHYIKINMLKWRPSWKSIWLPSQCLKFFLTGLVQNISFATEMNFLSLLVLEIRGKTCFRKVAILKSADLFLPKNYVPQEPMYHLTSSHGLTIICMVLSLQLLTKSK